MQKNKNTIPKRGVLFWMIRNSTTYFLVFTKQTDEEGIEVRVHDESVRLTQKGMMNFLIVAVIILYYI